MIKKDKSFDALRKNCTKTVEESLVLAQQKKNIQNGITLVALIIIIIVLLILATVSINLIVNGGIVDKAKGAVDTYSESEIGEQIKLAYAEWQTAQYSGTTENENEFIKNRLNNTLGSIEDVNKTGNMIMVTFSNGKIYAYSTNTSNIADLTNITSISKDTNENFVGYYADIDADGTVDGIIFADLLVGNTNGNQYGDENGTYEIPQENAYNLKNYYISRENYVGVFGTKDVISPKGSGKNRFYIMALSDFEVQGNSNFYWYYDADRAMNDYSETTSRDFGLGITNTDKMLGKWNNSAYGIQNSYDVWGNIQIFVKNGWFVPSKDEWAAFGNELKITSRSYGLKDIYHSSTQVSNRFIAVPQFYQEKMNQNYVNNKFSLRLATTF